MSLCGNCGKPRLLDLFSRKGGAGRGYQHAGFCTTGIDIEDHSDGYPGEFHQADAIEYLKEHGHEYAAVHASPPCQDYTALTAGTNQGRAYPRLIEPTREALDALGRPYVIENVPSKHIRKDVVLCGEMFGLAVIRHRYFELAGWSMSQPKHLKHRGRVAGMRHGEWFVGPYFAVYGDGGGKGSVADWQQAMGIDWMTEKKDLAEAIPPAYTAHIGAALIAHLTLEAAA